MALDLAAESRFAVTVADASEAALAAIAAEARVATRRADLSRPEAVDAAVADAAIVIGAVPGFLGYRTLERVIAAGRDVVDISFFEQDPAPLAAAARERGVRAIVDCGVAPGLTNLLAGHAAATFERLDRFDCGVGGLPAIRRLPWEYKAPFSPVDVLEIYTRPARVVEGGRVVAKPALSGVETIEFPGLGSLESFVSDGLRTLLETVDCPEMRELTLRYPGHAERMRAFAEAGFFSAEPVEIDGARIRPVDLTASLLFPLWQFEPGEEDLTAFYAVAEGVRHGRPARSRWTMLDRLDRASGISSMARTTGYTATAAVRLLADGLWSDPGLVAPEALGRDAACCERLLADLAARDVRLERRDDEPEA